MVMNILWELSSPHPSPDKSTPILRWGAASPSQSWRGPQCPSRGERGCSEDKGAPALEPQPLGLHSTQPGRSPHPGWPSVLSTQSPGAPVSPQTRFSSVAFDCSTLPHPPKSSNLEDALPTLPSKPASEQQPGEGCTGELSLLLPGSACPSQAREPRGEPAPAWRGQVPGSLQGARMERRCGAGLGGRREQRRRWEAGGEKAKLNCDHGEAAGQTQSRSARTPAPGKRGQPPPAESLSGRTGGRAHQAGFPGERRWAGRRGAVALGAQF